MIYKSLASIIVAMLISVVLIINTNNLLEKSQNKGANSQSNQNQMNNPIESEIFNLKLSEFETKSNRSPNKNYDLFADKAIIYQNGISKIENVDLKVYQNDNLDQYWQIFADLATHHKQQNKTHLTGSVKAINEFEKITLETNSLWVLHYQKLIVSNDQIYYQMPHQTINSQGIEIDYSNKIVNFQDKVLNLIEPNN